MTLVRDPDTRALSAGPPPAEVEEARLEQAILAAVAGRGEAEVRPLPRALTVSPVVVPCRGDELDPCVVRRRLAWVASAFWSGG